MSLDTQCLGVKRLIPTSWFLAFYYMANFLGLKYLTTLTLIHTPPPNANGSSYSGFFICSTLDSFPLLAKF